MIIIFFVIIIIIMIGIIILVFDSENTVKLEAMYLLVVPKFWIAEQHDWKCKCHMASKTYTMTKCTWCAQNLPRVSIFDQNKRRVRLRLFSRPPRYLCQGREMCFSDSKSYISCQVHIVYHWSTPHPPKDSRCQIIIIDGIIPFIIITANGHQTQALPFMEAHNLSSVQSLW